MVATVLLGGVTGLGVWVVWRAVRPRPEPLAAVVGRLGSSARPDQPEEGWEDRLGGRVLGWTARAGLQLGAAGADLAVVGRSREQHVARQVVVALFGLVVGVVVAGALAASLPTAVGLVVFGTAAGWWWPDRQLAGLAGRRREDFRHAFGAYLDVVNVVLAGGGGIATALHAAAEAGDGWVFDRLRRQLGRAQRTGRTPWEAFDELGEQLEISELRELAAAVSLVGDRGAQVRESLATRGQTLRHHQLAEIEADAEQTTQRMVVPLAVMFFSFLLFLMYPALVQMQTTGGGSVSLF